MKIDLHTHTSERSACAQHTEAELIRVAIERGLDAIAITDHMRLVPPDHVVDLNRQYAPFRIFGGIEIWLETEHIVVLGVQDPLLETTHWTYPELHHFVRKRGGYLILAHPRTAPDVGVDIESLRPDAMEVRSSGIEANIAPRIRELAARLTIPLLANSDGHRAGPLGLFFNEIDATPTTDAELMAALKRVRIVPCWPDDPVTAV
jgi:histidinol phosphatase-like PHP family hydrolase